ncbi:MULTISPECIES: M6 family metalloprotease domain-containing protein [Bacillus cereus group]|uniref:M6 family metalloprotease domain-containing protein n=1 Tax=Bacillus cereus group TaxID=86661 RepID=UPI000BF92AE9|nr:MULTISPECIES: M6 family metalloprotease domain-containing protein [Bacillus cereus group]MBJ8102141.1 M6 family metalloprotease domain-containing protein [Bacillus cereus group sp. N11]PGE69142.1 metalloprotease [Bacillus toyonensis]PHD34213.1 metalloprotease [Bacillus toyonensis]PHD44345.1 metalloprotease [Bacillus toyonensis]PRT10118.1 M6 family metalloprotease domain-containing protein [Bacillus toyonensis]
MQRIFKFLFMSVFSLICVLYVQTNAFAAPAHDGIVKMKQPSGESFEGTLHGDEWFHWVSTKDGDVILQDQKGYWNYAELTSDELKSTGKKYKIDKKPSMAVNENNLNKWITKYNPQAKKKQEHMNTLQKESPKNIDGTVTPVIGTKKLLVLLIGFTDVDIAYSDNDWSNKFFSTNQKSVKNYYNEVSNGKVQITPASEAYGTQNDGVVKIKLDYAHPSTSGKSMSTVITDALAKADSQVNFASFDTNNDQVIDSKDGFYIVSFLAGNEQAAPGAPLPYIWAHQSYASNTNHDGVTVSGMYTAQGEKQYGHMATIGIPAHELGHSFGLPDLYGDNNHVGSLSIMGNGSWNSLQGEDYGATPGHMDAWSKVKLGFVTPNVVNTTNNFTLNAIQNNYNVLKIPLKDNTYFLVENRAKVGYDASLPTNSGGIAVWHIDESMNNNSSDPHPFIDIEQSISEYQDPFYYTNQNHAATFGPDTNPNSNTYTGEKSGVTITTTSTSNSAMNVAVTTKEASLIPQTNWTLKYVDSYNWYNLGTYAFDGNKDTFWHTNWSPVAPMPHEIQIDLGATYNLSKFSYLPRQDGQINGTIKDYEFYVSSDGINWGTAVSIGAFANNTSLKEVSFANKTGRYIRLRALSEVNNNPWTSAAEINVFGVAQ